MQKSQQAAAPSREHTHFGGPGSWRGPRITRDPWFVRHHVVAADLEPERDLDERLGVAAVACERVAILFRRPALVDPRDPAARRQHEAVVLDAREHLEAR